MNLNAKLEVNRRDATIMLKIYFERTRAQLQAKIMAHVFHLRSVAKKQG